MLSNNTTYSLPWSPATSHEESGFHDEPEYSNTINRRSTEESDNSNYDSSPCPDYEEVHEPISVRVVAARKGLVYNLASENVFPSPTTTKEEKDTMTKEKIMQSTIYCIHKDEGCVWTGQLNKLKAHLNTCKKDAILCLNQCGAKIARLMMEDHMLYTCSKRLINCDFCKRDFTGCEIDDHTTSCGFEPVDCDNKCGQRIQRNRLRAHQANTCSKRLVGCAYCAFSFTADTLREHHNKSCARFPVPCPNRCQIEEGIAREEVAKHLKEECEAKSVQKCSFADAGCQFKTSVSSAMEKHLAETSSLHLDLMCGLAKRQQSAIDRLTGQLERAHTSYNGILMWKIKDFSAKFNEAKSTEGLELVSAPFYTAPQCGYKLQASLFLHGNGAGEGSHISVYIKILPGEFDSILRWPFKHTVSFSLLDQNDDRTVACNVVESFIPDPSWPNFQRPSRQPDQLGFGFPKFVPHSLLNVKGGGREYIKDDCAFIKIRVDPSRNVAV